MNPVAPTCMTDLIWWGFLFSVAILGTLISLLIKKGVIERLDGMAEKQSQFMAECHVCQEKFRESYVPRPEFDRLLSVRHEDHTVLNTRVASLESGQRDIGNKLSTIHSDISTKIERLSKTFIARDAVISLRLDGIADRAGVKWDKDQEAFIMSKLNNHNGITE